MLVGLSNPNFGSIEWNIPIAAYCDSIMYSRGNTQHSPVGIFCRSIN